MSRSINILNKKFTTDYYRIFKASIASGFFIRLALNVHAALRAKSTARDPMLSIRDTKGRLRLKLLHSLFVSLRVKLVRTLLERMSLA